MNREKACEAFEALVALTSQLRSPEGCAWDRAQTIASVRPHLVEELHEVLEALDHGDDEKLRDELGDLLYIVVLISEIAADDGRFELGDVVKGIDHKLRRRHPHVFAGESAGTPDEVRATWEGMKRSEKGHEARQSILDGLPRDLSALLTARRMQEKAAAVGFDWTDVPEVIAKAEEELGELRDEITAGRAERYERELGDLLFATVNLARFLNLDPEAALRKANIRFRRRFMEIEKRFRGRDLREVGLAAMDKVWNEAKKKERGD